MKKRKAKTKSTPEQEPKVDLAIEDASAVAAAPAPVDGSDPSSTSDTPVDEAPDTLESLQARIDKLTDSLLRAKADYKNLERRGTVERSEAIRFANAELMRSLLGVMDDFERSLEASASTDSTSALTDGVRLIYENMLKAMTSHGLEPIDALHRPFDPSVHEAMMQQPSAEFPPGTVIQELARGYQLRDRVLRPSKVIVSAAAARSDTSDSDQPQDASVQTDRE